MQNVTFLALSNESENINQPMMSSREIALLVGKQLKHVHRDIRAMVPALYAVDSGENVKSYKWDTNKEEMNRFLDYHKIQEVKPVFDDRGYVYEFLLDRRHTEILITGYDVKRRAAVIDRWFALESGEAIPLVQQQSATLPQLSTLEILQIAMKAEQGRLEEKARADEAVRTKSQISQKREAVALQRNSALQRKLNRATRERDELAAQFGASKEWASTQQVWRATATRHYYRPLMRWCDDHDLHDTYCFDPITNDYVLSFPHAGWLEVYGVDIAKLF
ncbi:Rha family transcriptional regulator [Xenorhabdus bovienii]|uniref:Putative DNA binding protein Roi n=1 Tax=Xenorhabdus bovienii str. Intermedium TaxID=1379677 RepID=A0A077QM02_XENBV|nr:Rha family transcriptional regulator [Xenorhabdus bovienii]CDH33351.1 putative DNA binding protein Roi [Xenorhabdus bovienii str. Intermedium]